MMERKSAFWVMFILSIAGVLFAGYLTVSKLLLGVCPLKEPCPSFFGYPACVYGFILFTTLLVLSAIMLFRKTEPEGNGLWTATLIVNIVGILFAATSIYKELSFPCPAGGCSYSLLLPTCIYGFAFFVGIFIFLLLAKRK